MFSITTMLRAAITCAAALNARCLCRVGGAGEGGGGGWAVFLDVTAGCGLGLVGLGSAATYSVQDV